MSSIHRSTEIPTAERLREMFSVSESGQLVRKISTGYRGCHRAGEVAGSNRKDGYMQVGVDGHVLLVHRVVFAIANGHWPQQHVDHIDGDRKNNRPENLRDVSCKVNLQNQRKAGSKSSTGLLGASPWRVGFKAEIRSNGKKVHLGVFATAESAHDAYVTAKRALHEGNTL